MESFEVLLRQLILYSLPLGITLTVIPWFEREMLCRGYTGRVRLCSVGVWLPLMASILFGRAMIVALPVPYASGLAAAALRVAGHLVLGVLGWVLYTWALAHPPSTGLPPLHHWWAKVLMYLNLCLMGVHLLPLPGLLVGELLLSTKKLQPYAVWLRGNHLFLIIPVTCLVVTPVMDMLLGSYIVFPMYEQLASWAE